MFKLYELLDTIFLVLKKKPLGFLHVYHHAMTALLCSVQLEGQSIVQWVPIVLNLAVHIVMYYYYARTAISSAPIWWKKYLTMLQIGQFVLDLIVIYYVVIIKALDHRACYGSMKSYLFGTFIITSYLFLFIRFFGRTYTPPPPKSKTT